MRDQWNLLVATSRKTARRRMQRLPATEKSDGMVSRRDHMQRLTSSVRHAPAIPCRDLISLSRPFFIVVPRPQELPPCWYCLRYLPLQVFPS